MSYALQKKSPVVALLRLVLAALALLVSLGLAGCGGGDSDQAPANANGEGMYQGSLTGTADNYFRLLVLESGEFWAFVGTSSWDHPPGFLHGSASFSNGLITGGTVHDYRNRGVDSPGSVSGTFNHQAGTIVLSVSNATGAFTFNGSRFAPADYEYDGPATSKDIEGQWSGAIRGLSMYFKFTSAGTFTGGHEYQGPFSGTFRPGTSGKNFFDITFTAGLQLPAGTSGFAVVTRGPDGRSTLDMIINDSQGPSFFTSSR